MKYTSSEMIKFHQPRGIDLRLVWIIFFILLEKRIGLKQNNKANPGSLLRPWAYKPIVVI